MSKMYALYVLTDDVAECHRLFGHEVSGPVVGSVINQASDALTIRWRDGSETVYLEANVGCLGFVALTAKNAPIELLNWWERHSGSRLAVCTIAATADGATRRTKLALWTFSRMSTFLSAFNQQRRETDAQISQLRRSYGALQGAFALLERFIVANKLHLPILEYETTDVTAFWMPRSANGKLIQILPVLSPRMSRFEIFFKASGRGNGNLSLALRLEPASQMLHQWQVNYADVLNGWNGFTPPPIVGDANEIILEVGWSHLAAAPRVGLSSPHWNLLLFANLRGDANHRRSLALRVWSGLPGMRIADFENSAGEAAFKESHDAKLVSASPQSLLRSKQHVFERTVQRDFPSVTPHESGSRLIVHPHADVPTIAIVDEVVPRGTTFISAECRTMHDHAATIQYAMAVIPPERAPESMFVEAREASQYFSGWLTVAPLIPKRISLVFGRPTEGGERLCIATRLPMGASENFAWSSWAALEFGIGFVPPHSSLSDANDADESIFTPPQIERHPDQHPSAFSVENDARGLSRKPPNKRISESHSASRKRLKTRLPVAKRDEARLLRRRG